MLKELYPRAHARYASLPILGGRLEGLCKWLRGCGYPAEAIRRRIDAAPMLERVLRRRGVRLLRDLSAADLRSFAPVPTRWTEHMACALVRSLVAYLGGRGELVTHPPTPHQDRVTAFEQHLKSVRGLAASTVVRHGALVSEFLHFITSELGRDLHDLRVADVEAFVAHVGPRFGRASMQKVAAVLRAYLRFLAARGQVRPGLDSHVESPRCFRGERLPRALPWTAVRALLGSIDRSTPKGLRDYAILLLIASYGLRVSEVAALDLGDIGWRSRQIRVTRPKIGTALLLPLTDEVATALLEYLRQGRPSSSHRRLFLRVRVPIVPIQPTAVSDVFGAWAKRSGIRLPAARGGGPHCLRHSLAVHLLRQGTPLKTIGDLLGHRSAESTCVYLRLQVDDLRDVALSLPSDAAAEVRR
jgi:site-specific recombinase XerD